MNAPERPLKLLVLSKYSRKGASSRYRQFQYYPYLQNNGVEILTEPLFDDDYLNRLYSKQNRILSVLKAYVRRAWVLMRSPDCNLVWVEKELFPWMPWFIERWFFSILGKPVVADYDDAIFHQYDRHRLASVRRLLGKKCDKVMRHCAVVIAGNQYLADRAKQAGSKNIVKVPTVVSESVFFPKESGNAIPVIGWIGSMSTAVYLSEIRSALVELQKKYDFQFRVVGAQLDWPELAVDNVPWSEGQEVAAVQSFDIGVMPLIDSYWERGKCGFKLVQYMACGKAVVADPVGVNVEIVDDGANGFLISAERTWYQALEALLQDAALRQSMGEQGRTRFQRKYSLETWREVILKVFYDVVSPKEKR